MREQKPLPGTGPLARMLPRWRKRGACLDVYWLGGRLMACLATPSGHVMTVAIPNNGDSVKTVITLDRLCW